MNRRQLLMSIGAGGLVASFPFARSAEAKMKTMPWEWVNKQGEVTNKDGTPLQFMPTKKDPEPLKDELKKHGMCPYCGMGRGHKKWRKTRHLIHYSDDMVDGTCSIHCAAVSLSLNLDRVPKAIYGADAGSSAEMPPLVPVEKLSYVIEPGKMGTMTMRRKWAYADKAKAKAATGSNAWGVGFDDALRAAYVDMAEDTIAIRKRRADKRKKGKMMKKGM